MSGYKTCQNGSAFYRAGIIANHRLTGYPLHRENGKKNRQGKHEIWKFCQYMGKTQGNWFAQVVNSLILKVKDISVFAVKIPQKDLIWISLLSQFCVCNSHK